jgi:hypothetical protein
MYKTIGFILVIVILLLSAVKMLGWVPTLAGGKEVALQYSRPLPANHQLVADDVYLNRQDSNRESVHDSLAAYLGRYLLVSRKGGDKIRAADLSRIPTVPTPDKDSAIFLLTLTAPDLPLLRLLEAGMTIQVADSSRPFRPGCLMLRVLALHGATSWDSGNWLLVEGLAAQAKDEVMRISAAARVILWLNKANTSTGPGCGLTPPQPKAPPKKPNKPAAHCCCCSQEIKK